MQSDLTGAMQQIQRMGDAFLQRLPYVLVALLVFIAFYLAAKVLRSATRRVFQRRTRHRNIGFVVSANGIDLPFDTRMVLFHDQTEEADGDRRRQREGWPAGQGEVPRPRSIAAALRELPGALGQEDRSRDAKSS